MTKYALELLRKLDARKEKEKSEPAETVASDPEIKENEAVKHVEDDGTADQNVNCIYVDTESDGGIDDVSSECQTNQTEEHDESRQEREEECSIEELEEFNNNIISLG